MKSLKTIAILLLILAFVQISKGQTYKVAIPNTGKHWIFQNLDDNPKIATLHKDTLFIHKRIKPFDEIKEQSMELRYLNYKNVIYRYQFAFYDPAYMYGKLKGTQIN